MDSKSISTDAAATLWSAWMTRKRLLRPSIQRQREAVTNELGHLCARHVAYRLESPVSIAVTIPRAQR